MKRWLAAMADGTLPSDDAVFLRAPFDVHTSPDALVSEVISLGNTACLRLAATPNPRDFVVLANPGDPRLRRTRS